MSTCPFTATSSSGTVGGGPDQLCVWGQWEIGCDERVTYMRQTRNGLTNRHISLGCEISSKLA